MGSLEILGLIALISLVLWFIAPRREVSRESWEPADRIEPVDQAQLEAAEREVRDRGYTPESDEQGDDWGPGSKAED